MAKADKKLTAKRERHERRFFPRPTAAPGLVYSIGAIGALLLGAGAWAQWLRVAMTTAGSSAPYGTWLLSAGIVATGVAIWFGTSGEPNLRVGDGGVAVEKGGLRRMPWYAVTGVSYEGANGGTVVVKGSDEGNAEMVVRARLASQPQAAAWIVAEARSRVPAVVTFDDDGPLPARRDAAGERLTLDPVQVVGKRCVASRTIIAFEPDARVCSRCERVYHKDHVPDVCACGGTLLGDRSSSTRTAADLASDAPDGEAPAEESHHA